MTHSTFFIKINNFLINLKPFNDSCLPYLTVAFAFKDEILFLEDVSVRENRHSKFTISLLCLPHCSTSILLKPTLRGTAERVLMEPVSANQQPVFSCSGQ